MDVPVVLIVFNRPHSTAKVLEALGRDKPSKLFIVADGAREGSATDREGVQSVRRLCDTLPWRCERVVNVSESNLGCRKRVVSGLNWVFQEVEQAIVLEDDIIPGEGFLRYCAELLERYRSDSRVGSISGVDFSAGTHAFTASYAFSRYNMFWGWATWRRAWALYDDNMSQCSADDPGGINAVVERTFGLRRERMYWKMLLKRVAANRIDSWGYRWLLSCWKAGLLGVHPSLSLVDNIGTGPDATHTRSGVYSIKRCGELRFPLLHPDAVERDSELDQKIEDRMYSRSLGARAAWFLQRVLGGRQ